MDRRYLACIAENYGGGPVGVETLAAALSEQRDVIEDVIEPYLMQLGLLMRTPRGRLLSEGGYRHLGMAVPKEQKRQLDLLAARRRRRRRRERADRARPSGRIDGRPAHPAAAGLLRGHRRAGIVYYANWLRFLERGRTELLRLLGQEHTALRAERGVNWVVRRCTIDYLKPARLDETIDVVTGCGELRGASLDMIQQARRGDELLVRAELIVACMSATGRPVRMPPIVGRLAQVRGRSAPRRSPRSRHIRILTFEPTEILKWTRLRRSPAPPLAAAPLRSTCRSTACSCRPTGSSRR